ncbi:hypothetical protein [Agromyces aerolatus]|uniref:hypothetical protein n=1 Tax=Agromyces sp. LY-1074 TaxID=3074080 RepID=UPI002863CD1C|nr:MULTISPECIES: hypothetical protein [unclassified Agromyces]MDR5698741.1 hypothetical protein [Agromyces sp. LY-1074]MDR5705035.1 hypothetical protein [Agromyces sp. LY-1358]
MSSSRTPPRLPFAAATVALVAVLSATPLSASAAVGGESSDGVWTAYQVFTAPPNEKETHVLGCPSSHPWLKRFVPGTLIKNDLAPDRPGNPGGVRVTAEPVIIFDSYLAYAENRVASAGVDWRVYRGVSVRVHTYNPFGAEQFALQIECVANPLDGAGDDPRPL